METPTGHVNVDSTFNRESRRGGGYFKVFLLHNSPLQILYAYSIYLQNSKKKFEKSIGKQTIEYIRYYGLCNFFDRMLPHILSVVFTHVNEILFSL